MYIGRQGGPGERPTFDFSDKWNSPKYDCLGEFYSSHVNPLFWRLHDWVDDCIDQWFKAHGASSPGRIRRRDLYGAQWFEVNAPWVMVGEPFVGVSLENHGGHHEHGGDEHGGNPKAAEIEKSFTTVLVRRADGCPRAGSPMNRRVRCHMQISRPGLGATACIRRYRHTPILKGAQAAE